MPLLTVIFNILPWFGSQQEIFEPEFRRIAGYLYIFLCLPITDIFGFTKPQLSAYCTNMGHEISFLTMSNLRNIYQYKSIFVWSHIFYFPSGKVPGPWNWHPKPPSLDDKTSHSQTDGSLVAAVCMGVPRTSAVQPWNRRTKWLLHLVESILTFILRPLIFTSSLMLT